MKFIRILIILFIIAAIGYGAYYYLLPEVISEAITSDEEIPSYIPEQAREELKEVREVVNEEVKKLPEKMEEMDLSYDDLVRAIDEMDEKDIMNTYRTLKESPPATTNEAYDIIVNNLDLQSVDMEKMRSYFNEAVTVEEINHVVDKAEKSKLFSNMSLPVLKNTIRQLLIQREDEIKDKLEEIE